MTQQLLKMNEDDIIIPDDSVLSKRQPHLAKQDASTVDPTKLTALTPEVVRYDKI